MKQQEGKQVYDRDMEAKLKKKKVCEKKTERTSWSETFSVKDYSRDVLHPSWKYCPRGSDRIRFRLLLFLLVKTFKADLMLGNFRLRL